MKDTTKTLSSKIPSVTARMPPNTASSAATTAIGRYGCTTEGTSTSNSKPTAMPRSRPMAGITGPPWSTPLLSRAGHLDGRGAPRQGKRLVCLDLVLDAVKRLALGEPPESWTVDELRAEHVGVSDRGDHVRRLERPHVDQDH